MLGSVLTAQSLEPASDSVSPAVSLPLPHSYTVSLCLSKINKYFFLMFIFERGRQSVSTGGAERERETQNLKQAPGSELSA